MPEIAEVARVVHFLRKHLVGRTIASIDAFDDPIVYGKVGTTAAAFKDALTGRRVIEANTQGKYFYILLDRPPHAVMHLGMTGWVKFNCEDSGYYKQAKEKDVQQEWPPKFMKFLLKCDAVDSRDALEVAFVDPRRLGRIRLVDCDAAEIRQHSPLKENGPDPVRDREKLTVGFLAELLRRKRVPVKALLLDQANISGVGNWVADEVLYQARIHPEQYSNTFDDKQIQRLHDSLIDVCTTACDVLADSTKFPETWLMKYRWNKGKKDSNTLPNGEKIVHLTVGGRTSAIVPSVQKKTAAVAGDVDEKDLKAAGVKDVKVSKRALADDDEDGEADAPERKKGAKRATKNTSQNGGGPSVKVEDTASAKLGAKSKSASKAEKPATPAIRRSSRRAVG